jgi:hypothetical protein
MTCLLQNEKSPSRSQDSSLHLLVIAHLFVIPEGNRLLMRHSNIRQATF